MIHSYNPGVMNAFYRVSAKALIFDDTKRLLVFRDPKREWEIPGGGWNHDEAFEACIRRELTEEMKLNVISVGPVACVYSSLHSDGYYKVLIAAQVRIGSQRFQPSGDGLTGAEFITKEQFLQSQFSDNEKAVFGCTNEIWALVDK